jgi:methylmalonyl-CoA mutase N-terminal domain/subunit
MSLATQLIIANETGVTNTVDPLAGSYFLDTMTDTMEEKAWEYIRKIQDMGDQSDGILTGMLRAVETGYLEREISGAAYEYQRRVETSDYVIVGVNEYRSEDAQPLEIFEYDTTEEERQIRRLDEAKRDRSASRVESSLSGLKSAALGDENLVPYVLESARACASEGEIMGALQEVYGEYVDPGVF